MTPFFRLPLVVPGADALALDPTKVSAMFTAPATTVPGQVTGLTAGAATATSQALTWTPPVTGGAVSDYLVEYRKDSVGSWTAALIGNSNPAFTVTGLQVQSTYQYRVTAVNQIGAGLASAAITAATADPYEAAAAGHWLFGTDSASLTGKGGLVLSPANTPPTFAAGYLATVASTTLKNGLLSPFDDSLEQTIAGVFQYKASGTQMLMGALASSSEVGGDALYRDSTGYNTNTRPGTGSKTAVVMPGLTDGAWFFAALSYTATGTLQRVFIGGNANSVTQAVNKAAAPRKIALGNALYSASSFSDAVLCAEFIYFSSPLDDAAMKALYARSKTRLAARGITVF